MKHGQPRISKKLPAEPYTQWEVGVESPSSACGPATMAALAEYWNTHLGADFIRGKGHFPSKAAHINYIYSHHGGRPWGMSVRRFTKGLKNYIHSVILPKDQQKLLITTFNDFEVYKQKLMLTSTLWLLNLISGFVCGGEVSLLTITIGY